MKRKVKFINFLKNKKCLFFGKKNCQYSLECYSFLKKKNCKVTPIWSNKRGEKFPKKIFNWKGDFLFSFHNYWLLNIKIIKLAKYFALNFHPGTPDYPGSGSYNWSVYDSKNTFGTTIHLMNKKFDNGEILKVYKFKYSRSFTVPQLIKKSNIFRVSSFKKYIDFLNKQNYKTIKTIVKNKKNYKWKNKAKNIYNLEKEREVNLKISKKKLIKKIQAFSSKQYPIFLYFKGFKFLLGE